MVQYKTISDTQKEIIKEWHGKIKRRELADKVGMTENQLKRFLRANKMRSRAGRSEIPFLEQRVNVYVSVKRKFYHEALAAAKKAVEEFKN